MGVSKNNGTPESSILIGFSIINHPFWGTPIFGNIHMKKHSFLFWRDHFQGMVVGHTAQADGRVHSRCGGRLILGATGQNGMRMEGGPGGQIMCKPFQ